MSRFKAVISKNVNICKQIKSYLKYIRLNEDKFSVLIIIVGKNI